MKTSNKILLGLVLIVFTIPFLLAATLSSKMKKGDYVVKKFENMEKGIKRTGSFGTFTVVKVVAPNPDLLRCHLKLSDKNDYDYMNYDNKDSIQVYTSADTLYIQYVARVENKEEKGRRYNNDFEIRINLPSFNNLVVDGAAVIIDSLPATMGSMSVKLQNSGVIRDGSKANEHDGAVIVPPVETKSIERTTFAAHNPGDEGTRSGIFKVATGEGLQMVAVDIKDLLLSSLLYKLN